MPKKIKFSVIVAMDCDRGIGKKGSMPWNISEDLTHFREITRNTKDSSKRNAVIMGRKTWESLPEKFRPLPGRINAIVTKNKKYPLPEDGSVLSFDSLEKAVVHLSREENDVENVFVIGGGQVYQEALNLKGDVLCKRIFVTLICKSYKCDTFFPNFSELFKEDAPLRSEDFNAEDGTKFYFTEYVRK